MKTKLLATVVYLAIADLAHAQTVYDSKTLVDTNSEFTSARREINREVETLKKEVDSKIQKAIDNPLSNK